MAGTKQKKKVGRVMHEFKHGGLKSGGSGRKVKSRKQAVAIAMSESGQSRNKKSTGAKRKASTARKSSTRSKAASRTKSTTRRKSTTTRRKSTRKAKS